MEVRDIKIRKDTIYNIALIFSFILCMLSIDQIRMRMFWIYILILIIAVIKKNRRIVKVCGCFCCIILLFYFYFLNNSLDKFRFPILKPFYEKEAKSILKDEKTLNDETNPHKVGERLSCLFLTDDHSYVIYRDNQTISIYLPTQRNFVHTYGYVYCENEFDVDAPGDSPRNDEVLAIQNYDYIDILDEHWAYIQIY